MNSSTSTAGRQLDPLLKLVVEKGASDLFITADLPPSMKVNGRVVAIGKQLLGPDLCHTLVLGTMNEDQQRVFLAERECNYALVHPTLGRFRASAFYQRNMPGMVLRRIETKIPTVAELGLPASIEQLAMLKRGLVFFVGATGTGKSTSLAAMIGHRNHHSSGHIISIEDPIEFIHEHDNCIVTQREVGVDTASYDVALRNTLRQAPDVIMIGEVRSRETIEYAMAFAETGHLCLATLHANNANQALERIIHFFPNDRHSQIWMDLSLNLRAIIAQQLVPTQDGQGRCAAIEVLLNSPLVADHIRKGEVHLIKDVMKRSGETGMCTFDGALYQLFSKGLISHEQALSHADAPNDLRLMIKLGPNGDTSAFTNVGDGLRLEETDTPHFRR